MILYYFLLIILSHFGLITPTLFRDVCYMNTRFFMSNTFISNARLKLTKNQARANQHPEAEPLQFQDYSLYSSTLKSKNNWCYFKKSAKHKCVCFNKMNWLVLTKIKLKLKNRSYTYDINKSRFTHGKKYGKYKMYLSMTMIVCAKQHLSNIWNYSWKS